jgi:hypothetical protein
VRVAHVSMTVDRGTLDRPAARRVARAALAHAAAPTRAGAPVRRGEQALARAIGAAVAAAVRARAGGR